MGRSKRSESSEFRGECIKMSRTTKRMRKSDLLGSKRDQLGQLSRNFNEISELRFKWLKDLETLALSRIKWTGLPESIDERFLEKTLMISGVGIFYDAMRKIEGIEESDKTIIFTKASPSSQLDLYDNPLSWTSYGNNGHFEQLEPGEAIPVYDTRTRKPIYPVIQSFADQLAELDKISLINRRQQRWAKIITMDERAQADAKMLQQSLDEGRPYLMGISGFADNFQVSTVDLSSDYLQADFDEDRRNLKNQCLGMLGIKNQALEKSQYQHSEEVLITNDEISRIREDLLSSRRIAAEMINKKFGLNVAVDWNNDEYLFLENTPSAELPKEKGEENNEQE